MCGIWAVFGSDESVMNLSCACHKISHRGPDCFRFESINHFPNSFIGFHRLAIMDDLTGMQPMRLFTHPHIWLVYNGEIYNFDRVGEEFGFEYSTKCDGEVIIHLFALGGAEFAAKHLDGVFAFVLLDTKERRIYLGRDTVGVRPMFKVYREDGFLGVCSEAKGLQGVSKGNGKIDMFKPGYVEAYSMDLNGKVAFEEQTRFHKIGELPKYTTPVPHSALGNNIKTNIRELFMSAVRKRMMAEPRVGCMLSGGLDSSLITAVVVNMAKGMGLTYPVQTFSIGMEGSTDLLAARKVAKHLQTEHHEVIFTPEEAFEVLTKLIYHLECYDITNIRASIGMYLISKYIAEKTDTKVIFSGEGSDELTQGYIYFHKAPSQQAADTDSRRLLNDLYMYDVLRSDRTTAAWGLELRVPFLDHQFISYYLSISPELRQPVDNIEKHLLRSAFKGFNLIPDDILWRPKEAFSDGVSSSTTKSLFEILQEFAEKQIDGRDLAEARSVYPVNSPLTKESLYYRRLFEKFYPNCGHFTPYMWMPKWTDATDPSARTLKHYTDTKVTGISKIVCKAV